MRKLLFSAALAACIAGPGLAAGDLTYVVNNESATYDPGLTSETFAAPRSSTVRVSLMPAPRPGRARRPRRCGGQPCGRPSRGCR